MRFSFIILRAYVKRYYDTSFELSVFWPSDTESQINEVRKGAKIRN